MKILFLLCPLLTFATAALPICPAHADEKLSTRQRGKLWTLTQDIVSVGFQKDFQNGDISNRERIRFGIYQVALRHSKLFQDDNKRGTTRVSAPTVAAAATEYFGQAIQHQSVGDWKYRDGFYHGYPELFEQLGDEKITGFRAENTSSNRFMVTVNFTNLMAAADANRDVIERAKLTFKSATVGGKERYVLDSFVHLTPRL